MAKPVANVNPYLLRCEDCEYRHKVKGEWCCSECFDQKCAEIDECPEGITVEQIAEIDEKTKDFKLNLGARAENADKKEHKPSKPRQLKPQPEKEEIIAKIAQMLEDCAENVTIVNKTKIIEFDLGGNHFKVDLIKQKKTKK